MKKTAFLESSVKLSQIEARLTKNAYLSSQSLPSHADAKVFLLIEKAKKTPDRQKHPQLYHWYIIMKQFARRTLETWIDACGTAEEEDQLIADFLIEMCDSFPCQIKDAFENPPKTNGILKTTSFDHQKLQKSMNTPKNTQKRKMNQNYVELNENIHSSLKQIIKCRDKSVNSLACERTPLNLITQKNEACSPSFDPEFIMQMQLNILKQSSPEVIRERLAKEKVEILSFEVEEEIHLRVFCRIDKTECEELKDRISKWSEVSNIRFRKDKKIGSRVEIKSQNSISPSRKLPDIL